MIRRITTFAISVLLQCSTLIGFYALEVSALALAVRSSMSLSTINLPSLHEHNDFKNTSIFHIHSPGPTSSSVSPVNKPPALASWPATPFRVSIPIATPPHAQYSLYVTSASPVDRSELAKSAILSACQEMIEWIDTFVPFFESYVLRPHTIIQDIDQTGILVLDLFPYSSDQGLSRRLALRGFETFRALIKSYGEADLRFELWEGTLARGVGRVTVGF